ncbi:hypothetical protein [Parasphingopyxis sp.]|uniref:hypothetical protein n=1 Tax=Parasphingopyxis sp. TaxID=1920299 RepID=UPI00262DB6B3|nr:hypothetical protein [Parasphingopyxis sp.]
MSGSIARRYWFADNTALTAIRNAEDPSEWECGALPVAIFCLDDDIHEAMRDILEPDEDVQLVDARNPATLSDVLSTALGRETARHLQFAFHAIEDFGPTLGLLCERLENADSKIVQTDLLAIGPFDTQLAADLPERCWIPAQLLRDALAGETYADVSVLKTTIADFIAAGDSVETRLIAGGVYLNANEVPVLTEAENEAALWRARTAAAWAEIDRLQSEKRVRAEREQALAARHERDLARQAERSRQEIDRLHRAAGWPGRWRARFARLFGR